MQAESLEVLEKASVAPAQARAFVRAIEIEIAGAADTLATKHDFLRLETMLRGEMSALRVQIAQQNAELRAEMHGSAGGIKREMYTAILGQMAVLLGFAYFFATHLR